MSRFPYQRARRVLNEHWGTQLQTKLDYITRKVGSSVPHANFGGLVRQEVSPPHRPRPCPQRLS
eukprot:8327879-Pyramimonas_sp.AAC.1